MAKQPKIKTVAVNPPRTQAEAEAVLADIGHLQRQVTAIESAMNDELITIKDRFEKQAQPINEEIEAKFQALHVYAEANRDTLLKGKAKTAKLSTGEMSWRITPPSVRITGGAAVIDALKRLGLGRFLRTKEEVNKEAILAEPDAVVGVKGIAITQKEEFVIKPFESEIERAETVNRSGKVAA